MILVYILRSVVDRHLFIGKKENDQYSIVDNYKKAKTFSDLNEAHKLRKRLIHNFRVIDKYKVEKEYKQKK